jgi:hypothetical protein
MRLQFERKHERGLPGVRGRAVTRARGHRIRLACVIFATLLFSLFGVTRYIAIAYVSRRGIACGVVEGVIACGVSPTSRQGLILETVHPKTIWLPQLENGGQMVMLPLWIPALGAFTAAVLADRKIRCLSTSLCRKCDYDLTGNVTGVCPECGTLR